MMKTCDKCGLLETGAQAISTTTPLCKCNVISKNNITQTINDLKSRLKRRAITNKLYSEAYFVIKGMENEIKELKAENESIKARIAGGVRVYAYQKDCDGEDWAVTTDAPSMDNATLLLDEQGDEQ